MPPKNASAQEPIIYRSPQNPDRQANSQQLQVKPPLLWADISPELCVVTRQPVSSGAERATGVFRPPPITKKNRAANVS